MKLGPINLWEQQKPERSRGWVECILGGLFVIAFMIAWINWLSFQPEHPTDIISSSGYTTK